MYHPLVLAVVFDHYGPPDVLRLEDVPMPEPGDDEVLVRVVASSVNASDWHILRADPLVIRGMTGLLRPKLNILGADVAGVVEDVGSAVTAFAPGDAVYGDLSECGMGGFAEFTCASEKALSPKPVTISFLEAATIPAAGVTALQALRDAGSVKPGEHLLINGASGGVGSFAIQIAKVLGADVTGVCSGDKRDFVESMGADETVDYTATDIFEVDAEYDVVIDTAAYHSIGKFRALLKPDGRYVQVGGSFTRFLQAALLGPLLSLRDRRTFRSFLVRPNVSDLAYLTELVETGQLAAPVDRSYPLRQAADAIRYLENRHVRGKIGIAVACD